MRDLLGHKAMHLDRAVCCFLVAVNVGAFSTKVELRLETVIGAVNASLAAALLAASLWRPRSYAQSRRAGSGRGRRDAGFQPHLSGTATCVHAELVRCSRWSCLNCAIRSAQVPPLPSLRPL